MRIPFSFVGLSTQSLLHISNYMFTSCLHFHFVHCLLTNFLILNSCYLLQLGFVLLASAQFSAVIFSSLSTYLQRHMQVCWNAKISDIQEVHQYSLILILLFTSAQFCICFGSVFRRNFFLIVRLLCWNAKISVILEVHQYDVPALCCFDWEPTICVSVSLCSCHVVFPFTAALRSFPFSHYMLSSFATFIRILHVSLYSCIFTHASLFPLFILTVEVTKVEKPPPLLVLCSVELLLSERSRENSSTKF